VRTLSIEDGRFNSIAFSAVSGQLASGSTDGFVRIWSPLKHERPIQQIKHGRQVKLVRFSPDGKRLLSMGRLGAARIWDVGTESLTRAIPTGMSESKDARFSPDGSSIAVATQDGRIRVWRNGSEIPQILEPNPLIESLVFSDDGKRIVTGSYSGVIRSWSVADGNLIDVHETGLGIIGDLEFLKGTSLLATPTIAGQLLVFDTEARREIRSLRTHSLTGGILDRSANGRVLAVGSGGGSVKLLKVAELTRPDTFWHTASAQDDEQGVRAETTPGRAVGNPIRGLAIPAGGRYVVAASADGAVSKWNIDNGIPQPLFLAKDDRDPLLCASSDPAGRYVACGYQKSGLALWNLKTGKPGRNIDVGEAAVVAVAFSTKGDVLAVATGEGRLRAFAGADLARLRFEESPPEGEVNAVVFSPDGQELVVAYNDGVVLFLDASTGRPRRKRLRLPSIPLTAVYCEAGALLAVGTQTGAIEFIEVGDGSVRRTIHAHSSRVNVVAAFPDGRTIVSGGRDKELKLWDTGSGDLITTLYGHGRQILSIAVSPDGRTVASGGLLGDVRVWRSGTR
jgi:WD40 repeat protein